MNALEVLREYDIDTSSANLAVVSIRNKNWTSARQYEAAIRELVPDVNGLDCTDYHLTRLTFGYLVQGIVASGDLLTDTFMIAKTKAETLLRTHSWIRAQQGDTTSEPAEGVEVKADNGSVKRKKGAKLEHARQLYLKHCDKLPKDEIIKLFVDEVGLTPLGASSYYYVFKKERPNTAQAGATVKQRGKKPAGERKIDKAIAMFKQDTTVSKDAFIKRLVTELDMTPAGAQTYYYNAKKACS